MKKIAEKDKKDRYFAGLQSTSLKEYKTAQSI